jgi:hypothetical protein
VQGHSFSSQTNAFFDCSPEYGLYIYILELCGLPTAEPKSPAPQAALQESLRPAIPPALPGKSAQPGKADDRIRFACPQCKQLLRAPKEAAGKESQCPKCGTELEIPKPAQD